jgi:hypothetical protein
MNEAAMLPHIIQCPSNAVLNPEHRADNEKAEKMHRVNREVSKVGGT